MLHSGGDAALKDLSGGVEEVFLKGPEAVEFLGDPVTKPWPLVESSSDDAQQGVAGGGAAAGGAANPTRFYTRTAIVCWPRAKRCARAGAVRGGRTEALLESRFGC